MGLDRIKRDIDPEHKAFQGKQIRDEKKSETSDQRLEKYTWSLRDLSKTGLVTFTLAMAGIVGGVEARPESPGSALQRKGHDNATVLPPAFNQKEFNNLSHRSALEFDPHQITQADRARLKELGMTDQEIENVRQGKYEEETSSEQKESSKKKGKDPLSSNGEKIDALQSLMDQLEENPEVLQSFKKKLNERVERAVIA